MSKETFDAKKIDNACEKQPFNRLFFTIYFMFHCNTYCYIEIVFKDTM